MKNEMNRRQFASLGAATLGSLLTQTLWSQRVGPAASPDKFYIALIADTHIIDDFYVRGSENSDEDNESILQTAPRLISARDLISSLEPGIEHVFILGDYFHNYPSPDFDFYFKNTTRLDAAKAITDRFKMPVHLGFGNHDYDVRHVSREMSHRLFEAKFNAKPYSALDYKGWKFIHLNNFLGSTQDRESADFNPGIGSFGEEQLLWFEAQLKQQQPTFVFVHFPLVQNAHTEFSDYGLYPLLRRHQDTIRVVVAGHTHKWIDFGRTYGPLHYTMAATRYDANAYMLIEVDTKRATWQFINADLVEWSTHFSKPYRGNNDALKLHRMDSWPG